MDPSWVLKQWKLEKPALLTTFLTRVNSRTYCLSFYTTIARIDLSCKYAGDRSFQPVVPTILTFTYFDPCFLEMMKLDLFDIFTWVEA